MAQGLIADDYCMKGFRIDTKSCNWGPMAGFVCADPRLTKDAVYETRNKTWTHEALSGHIVEKFFGKVEDADWKADVMPIAISKERITELTQMGMIRPRLMTNGHYVGESSKGNVTLYWRLIPAINAYNWWLKVQSASLQNYFVLCVDTQGARPFYQQYPTGVEPIMFRGYETILGLTNPGTKPRGFKACVTADYDLFSVWSGQGKDDRMSMMHNLNAAVLNRAGNGNTPLAGGVARMPTVDQRLQSAGQREHHRFGDVSARIMNTKALLNTAIQSVYRGGNAIHHNDEAGNFALAKGTLVDCLPLIGFMPGSKTVLVEDLADFKELVLDARAKNFKEIAKEEWLKAAGL